MVIAAYMGYESVSRLVTPRPIHFDEAIPVAMIGLIVNIVSAWLLSTRTHDHDESRAHAHDHHHDLNLRSAYAHVVADAATSLLAIVALLGGRYLSATWLDPAMGLVGSVLVGTWAWNLIRRSARALLDAEMDAPVVEEVREVVRTLRQPAVLRDLHVWRVGKGQYACIVSVAAAALTAAEIHERLTRHEELVHVTVEIDVPRA
jgi:cation diffusion facilitator family transporter